MEPIVLIHGYSAESKQSTPAAIVEIYGTLPRDLREIYGRDAVVEIDLGRYISLEDGLTIDDISRALDRVLREDFPQLLAGRFHVIVHSTGALVIRNWIRLAGRQPSPIGSLVYLAGANFGSGWAHIGKGQLVKWARAVFQGGTERGVQVLDALELGSSWTLDLHLHFLQAGTNMSRDYGVREHIIMGTQADVRWFEIPIRYAKEDGSDGVVRVSGSNLNFNYVRFGPTERALRLQWGDVDRQHDAHLERAGGREAFYEIKEHSRPGDEGRPEIPFAILYACAHTGDEMGIVVGTGPRVQVLDLIRLALEAKPDQWAALVPRFNAQTTATYDKAKTAQAPQGLKKLIAEPRAQYDPHAQVIFRLRDQDGRPVPHYDIFFDSIQGQSVESLPIGGLFEDKHVNDISPNVITFFLRTDPFDRGAKDWVSRIPAVDGCYLEVTAVEPETDEIIYLPLRYQFSREELVRWIQGHHTTVIDVDLLRLPSPKVLQLVRYSP